MNNQITYLLRLLVKEMWSKPKLTMLVYILSSVTFLTAAWVWPRIYTSTSVILIDTESILSPLMRGTAVTTEIVDEAKRARQIILSRTSIEKVLDLDVWNDSTDSHKILNEPSKQTSEVVSSSDVADDELKIEILSKIINANTNVKNLGRNIIELNFESDDPKVAYETATLLTDIFVNESIYAKQSESRSAFEFIDNQVTIYQNQQKEAELAIKNFRSKNVGLTPGAQQNASTKLIELNADIETAELSKSAEEASILIRQKQLKGEIKEISSDIENETLLSGRIADLEGRLDELLLSYKETYPDVVQLKSQITTLKQQLTSDVADRENPSKQTLRKPTHQVAQEFRRQISLSENNIAALNARIKQLKIRINNERKILAAIISVEAEAIELTRDQTVNQEMYNKLLSQRENARISMNIDIQNQGQTMKVQEYPSLPYLPRGLRFSQIILAGLILSFLAPAASVFILSEFDQKVRSQTFFNEKFKVPVLATIHTLPSLTDTRENRMKMLMMTSIVVIVWCIYAYAIYLKRFG